MIAEIVESMAETDIDLLHSASAERLLGQFFHVLAGGFTMK